MRSAPEKVRSRGPSSAARIKGAAFPPLSWVWSGIPLQGYGDMMMEVREAIRFAAVVEMIEEIVTPLTWSVGSTGCRGASSYKATIDVPAVASFLQYGESPSGALTAALIAFSRFKQKEDDRSWTQEFTAEEQAEYDRLYGTEKSET